jgi:transposase InsO family protein
MTLHRLSVDHPDWKASKLAETVGHSERWARKWLSRVLLSGTDQIFESLAQVRAETFSYVTGFYNRIRGHSALGYLSPIDFKMHFMRQTCTPSN